MISYLLLYLGLTVTRFVSTMLVVGEMYLSCSQLVFLLGSILSFMTAAAKHNERRLLLNDPDITGRRLAHLESTQQELTKLLARCNATIAALQAKDVAVETTNSDLQSKYTALQSIAVQLESHTTKQDKMIATLQGKYLYLYLKVVFHR